MRNIVLKLLDAYYVQNDEGIRITSNKQGGDSEIIYFWINLKILQRMIFLKQRLLFRKATGVNLYAL